MKKKKKNEKRRILPFTLKRSAACNWNLVSKGKGRIEERREENGTNGLERSPFFNPLRPAIYSVRYLRGARMASILCL